MGPAEISWKAFMLSDGSVNLISLDPLAADVVHSASDILHTIEAGQLVLNNSEYTLAELAIVRLIANGLPRFAAPADAINIPILDNFVTLRFDVTILYHEAVPVIPFAVPTYYSIGSILTKLAFKTSTSDDYLSGLVMAIAVSFFYQGQGNLNCIVNAFAEYRRLKWPRPIFKNLLYAWLRLNNQTEHITEKLELASALKGPLVEIVQSFILTNMIISTATSTIFHRWSASANLLQMYMTRAANANYGSTAVYLEAHLEAPYNETSASFFSAVYLAIKDLCYDDLPIGACNISRWNGGRGSVNADLANNEAWIGRWDRRIVYPCQPYTVLGLMSLGRQFGGYTPTVLSAISQNCRVDAWNRPQFIMFDCDQRQDIPLPAETIEPALVYDAAASLVVVGTMWHFDWFRQQGFGIRWDCNQLPTRVRILIEYKATHLLVAGVNATGDGTVFSATGRPSNLKKNTTCFILVRLSVMHSLLDIYEVAGVDIKDMINKLRCYAAELLERFDAIKDQVGIAPFCLALQVICKDGGLYVDNTYVCRYSLWDRYAVRSEYKSCDDLKGKLIEANVLKCHHGLKRCKLHRRWHYAKLAHHNSRDEYKYLNEVFPFASAGDESHTRVDLATICFSITTNKKLCDDEAINVVFTICPLGTYNSLVTAPPSQISASDIFSKYYRGVLIDEGNVSSDLQGTLGISKALAGYLTSAVTMGPAEISWKAFMLSDGSVNLISLDPLAADVVHSASDILHTIEAGQLVLNNSEYTLAELAIVRLIANGLPRFAAPADAINIPILDNFVTLRFDVTILYHEAVPVIPFAVPTYYSIGSILTKLAFKTSTSDDYLSGLVMAIAVSFFYQGQGNLNCIVNAFAEYRRLKWPRPIFKNLLYAWLRLNNQTEHITEKLELASALKGPLVEIVQSFILTNMIISTATSTIFHRWSASANLLQMYMTRAANANYGSTAVYLEAHLEAPYNETSASFFSAVYLAIKDLCYDDLPIGACNISRWNGGRGSVNADLANNEAWIGRWDRRIVYPCQPYTVLGLMSLGRQFGGTWVLQLH
ncbi:hypothetical protein GJ496_001904 [Pomphorhynchus laevis]|nr:hypothetical protein GJ496_001904 [Pomphorhynchus laevis]